LSRSCRDSGIYREIQNPTLTPHSGSDRLDNGYALSLNLAIWLGPKIQQLLSYEDLSNFHGNERLGAPIPATFVVGRDGLVKRGSSIPTSASAWKSTI